MSAVTLTVPIRAAVADAEPPDEPPVDHIGLSGFRHTPFVWLSVTPPQANSGTFVFPRTTQWAAFRTSTSSESFRP